MMKRHKAALEINTWLYNYFETFEQGICFTLCYQNNLYLKSKNYVELTQERRTEFRNGWEDVRRLYKDAIYIFSSQEITDFFLVYTKKNDTDVIFLFLLVRSSLWYIQSSCLNRYLEKPVVSTSHLELHLQDRYWCREFLRTTIT